MTTADRGLLGRVMLAFDGEILPPWIAGRLAQAPAAGMTLFRHGNVRDPAQVRELTDAFRRAAGAGQDRALLVAADQEGGQLLALGDAGDGSGPTSFAGNMALGAVDDPDLSERVGRAIGLEARAMGVDILYAPVLDLASNPDNVAVGTRSFGEDPALVARHGAALVRGLQSAGVAAGMKHFPGLGDAGEDTHHGGATISADREHLEATALGPFRAAIAAGARVAMSSHVTVPALTGDTATPATLSRAVMTGLLRDAMGFGGLSISDALDMGALAQGDAQAGQLVQLANAGVDLLLCAADRGHVERVEAALRYGAAGIDPRTTRDANDRLASLRAWLATHGERPDLDVVGCSEHRALEAELAARSLTLVRDPHGWLPLSPGRGKPILSVMPTPTDLTPADTSSTVRPTLAAALREWHPAVHELVVPSDPREADVAAAREAGLATDPDLIVVGTLDARRQRGQVALVAALAALGRPIVVATMRTPWDASLVPPTTTVVACHSIHEPSMRALAAALAGRAGWPGRIPVRGVTIAG